MYRRRQLVPESSHLTPKSSNQGKCDGAYLRMVCSSAVETFAETFIAMAIRTKHEQGCAAAAATNERRKQARRDKRDDDPIQEQRAKRRRSAQSYPFSRNENRRASSEPASEEVSDRRRWCVRRTDELSAFFLLARNSQEAKLKIKCAKIKCFY